MLVIVVENVGVAARRERVVFAKRWLQDIAGCCAGAVATVATMLAMVV